MEAYEPFRDISLQSLKSRVGSPIFIESDSKLLQSRETITNALDADSEITGGVNGIEERANIQAEDSNTNHDRREGTDCEVSKRSGSSP